jgi:hypothetical protein
VKNRAQTPVQSMIRDNLTLRDPGHLYYLLPLGGALAAPLEESLAP